MNNYSKLEAEVREQAEAKFEASGKQERNERRRFVREAVDEWFNTTELYSSIEIRRDRSVEITDEYYGSSITVYPPERRWAAEPGKIEVVPAYINASTWQTGKHSVANTQRRTLHYLKMVDIAVETQNEMNQALVDWPDFHSPMTVAEREHSELLRFREEQNEHLKLEAEKKAKKQQKTSAA